MLYRELRNVRSDCQPEIKAFALTDLIEIYGSHGNIVQWDSVHCTYLYILPSHSFVQHLTGMAQQWDQAV